MIKNLRIFIITIITTLAVVGIAAASGNKEVSLDDIRSGAHSDPIEIINQDGLTVLSIGGVVYTCDPRRHNRIDDCAIN